MLRAYVEAGHSVHFIALSRGDADGVGAQWLRQWCEEVTLIPMEDTVYARTLRSGTWLNWREVLGRPWPWSVWKYYSPMMEMTVQRAAQDCDIVHFCQLTMVPYMKAVAGNQKKVTRLVLDLNDVDSVVRSRELATGMVKGLRSRLFCRVEQAKLAILERRIVNVFNMTLVCSEIDRDRLRSGRVKAIPNGAELPHESTVVGLGDGRTLLFVGFIDYPPNADGILWFVDRVFPRVRRMAPEAQLVVVGRCSDPRILALDNRACIRVVGEVEDLTPYYNMASVVVVPLRVGGGTRIKIIEAFGWKRSVVATRLAVEGIPATPTRELFVEDDPEHFALRCVDILRDPSMRREMGERARKFADAYEWAKIRRRMIEVVYSDERDSVEHHLIRA